MKSPNSVQKRARVGRGAGNAVDVHIGNRIRTRRILIGMSQERLGSRLGISFQQVQKYERGVNRVSSSRLFDFATVLDVPIEHFFEGITSDGAVRNLGSPPKSFPEGLTEDTLTCRETLRLINAYYGLGDYHLRKAFVSLMRTIGRHDSWKTHHI